MRASTQAPAAATRATRSVDRPPDDDPIARRTWTEIVRRLAARNPRAASIYGHAAPLSVAPGRIVIGYEAGSFLLKQACAPECQQALAAVASDVLGAPTELEIDTSGAYARVASVAAVQSEEQKKREAELRRETAEHPLVLAAMQMFDARLRDVRLTSVQS